MKATIDMAIEGIGAWSTAWANWTEAREVLSGNREPQIQTGKPAAAILSAGERRRATDSVRLALDVAGQACTMAGREPDTLANVFASGYGDLQISDYLCATLAANPRDISPTRFHNSVHNAAAGYWAIATGCRLSSTAISAGKTTFGAGLIESVLQAMDLNAPVLFVASDIAASGPLADVVACREAFGVAMVLSPASTCHGVHITLGLAPAVHLPQATEDGNPAAHSLPLLRAIALRRRSSVTLAAGPDLYIDVEMQFD